MNQTLLMFLFYKSQTWITPLSLWEVVLYVWFCSYVKKGLPFSQDLPLEYSGILWILFLSIGFTSFVVLLFFLYQHHLLFLHVFWCYFIYRRWDSLNQLKLMSIRRNWPILVELIDLVNFVTIFLITNNRTQVVNWPAVTLTVLIFWIYFFWFIYFSLQ